MNKFKSNTTLISLQDLEEIERMHGVKLPQDYNTI